MNCSRPTRVHSTRNAREREKETEHAEQQQQQSPLDSSFFLPYPISNNHNIGHGTQHFMYHSLCTHVRIYAHKCGSISTGERDHTRQEHRMKHTKKHHQIAVISNIQKKPFKCISKFYPIGELYACARIFTQRRHRVVFSCDWHFCMPFARHCKLNRRHLLALMMLKTNFANKTRERDYLQI